MCKHLVYTGRVVPPMPHDVFRLFVDQWPRVQHSLSYIGHGDQFPIGKIGDKSDQAVSADQARYIINDAFASDRGPIIHVALAPHDPPDGHGHNVVITLDDVTETTVCVCDAVIIKKGNQPFAIETLLGDCACIVVASDSHVGFVHCGAPELFAEPNILQIFWGQWVRFRRMNETLVFLGPCITGRNYAYQADMVPAIYRSFTIECDGHETLFDAGQTFALPAAIAYDLRALGFNNIDQCDIDPFAENLKGNHDWASARYAQFEKNVRRQGDGLSPRDCAMFTYRPDPVHGR